MRVGRGLGAFSLRPGILLMASSFPAEVHAPEDSASDCRPGRSPGLLWQRGLIVSPEFPVAAKVLLSVAGLAGQLEIAHGVGPAPVRWCKVIPNQKQGWKLPAAIIATPLLFLVELCPYVLGAVVNAPAKCRAVHPVMERTELPPAGVHPGPAAGVGAQDALVAATQLFCTVKRYRP